MKAPQFTVTRKVWLPVRCCCTPTKIFGFLQLSEEDAARSVIEINRHRIEIKPLHEGLLRCRLDGCDEPEHLDSTTERAVYSDDRPLSFWRRMPGFVEAVSPNRVNEPLDSGR
jgi:hypothetical protein